jgi:hypothetical protein
MPCPPRRIESVACQTRSYEDWSRLTQRSAATVAPRSRAALPVSVRRYARSGVSRLRPQAVRPEKRGAVVAPAAASPLLLVVLDHLGSPQRRRVRIAAGLA